MKRLILGLVSLCVSATINADTLQQAAEAFVHEAERSRSVAIVHATPDGVDRAIAGSESITTETMFEIGSVTKVFTGILLADLVLRGEVTLETTIGAILGDAYELDPAVATITLRELATHTSGLTRMPPGLAMFGRIAAFPSDPYRGLTTERLFDDLAALQPTQLGPRGQSAYSNFGMAVLGRLLERVAGIDYETLLRQRVLSPMGLDGMDFTDTLIGTGNLTGGHRSNLQPTRNWHLGTFAPAGGLAGNMVHLERFLLAAMQAEAGSAMALAIDEGLGWAVSERGDRVLVWHNGQTGGFHAFVGFRAGDGHGVVVLSNTANGADAFAISILEGAPVAAPQHSALVPLGFTVVFTLLGPLMLFGFWRQVPSRLHVIDAVLATVFLLAVTWKLGLWVQIPIALWYLALVASVVLLGLTVGRLEPVPWTVSGKPWSVAAKSVSVLLFAFMGAWALLRL